MGKVPATLTFFKSTCFNVSMLLPFELVDGDEVEAMLDFEAVASVPVAAFFYESMM